MRSRTFSFEDGESSLDPNFVKEIQSTSGLSVEIQCNRFTNKKGLDTDLASSLSFQWAWCCNERIVWTWNFPPIQVIGRKFTASLPGRCDFLCLYKYTYMYVYRVYIYIYYYSVYIYITVYIYNIYMLFFMFCIFW